MAKNNKQKIKIREQSLDILRGIAVFLMVLAHTIAFFHNQENALLRLLQNAGDTVCFTIFLFVSGASSYIAYINTSDAGWPERKSALIQRILRLVFWYYVIALTSSLGDLVVLSPTLWPKEILDIFIFIKVPGYTEFLIPFMVYSLFILLTKTPLKKFLDNNLFLILFGISTYFVGYLLYSVQVSEPLLFYKSIFAGHEGLYRFPIFQYFPVFLTGLYIGKFFILKPSDKEQIARLRTISLVVLFFVFLAGMTEPIASFPYPDRFQRWPPSIAFIITGISFAFLVLTLSKTNFKKAFKSIFANIFTQFGKHAFSIYVTHILILQLKHFIVPKKSSDVFLILSVFTILLTTSFLISKLFTSRKPKAKKVKFTKIKKFKSREFLADYKYLLTLFTIFVVSCLGIVFFIRSLNKNAFDNLFIPNIGDQATAEEQEEKFARWWNYDYTYRRHIIISNLSSSQNLARDQKVQFQLDHKTLISQNKSIKGGTDLKLVYLEDEQYSQIPFGINSPNSKETAIIFDLRDEIEPQTEDESYFLYYGDEGEIFDPSAKAPDKTESLTNPADLRIWLGNETYPQVYGQVDRHWILKDTDETQFAQLNYSIELEDNIRPKTKPSFEILETGQEGLMSKQNNGTYKASITSDVLDPGIYTLQASFTTSGQLYRSQKSAIVVSYPVYVAMTLDWEGDDVSDEDLARVTKLSQDHYDMPFTQFFNPNIYANKNITKQRADYLTNWVNQRYIDGDEIGLHLHMGYELVKAAGVKPKKEPRWTDYLDSGHDVPCTAYTYKQFSKILQWSKQQFSINELPNPISFRAGGWFADLDTLQALDSNGFIIDSSGREYFAWGQNQLKGEWDLESTTQPYRPSTTNQNQAAPAPNFSLWEFPNNGANSRFYKSEQLIQNLGDNHTKGYLIQPKVVTYLSHPGGIDYDLPTLNETFDYIDKRTINADGGPIIYTTLYDTYKYLAY